MAANWKERDQIYRRYLQQAAGAYETRQDLRAFTELLLTLTMILVFGLFAIKPTLITITALTAEIREKEKVLETMDTKTKNLITAQTAYERERKNIEILNKTISETSSPSEITGQMEKLATRAGAVVLQMEISDAPIKGSVLGSTESKTGAKEKEETFPSGAGSFGAYAELSGNYSQLIAFFFFF